MHIITRLLAVPLVHATALLLALCVLARGAEASLLQASTLKALLIEQQFHTQIAPQWLADALLAAPAPVAAATGVPSTSWQQCAGELLDAGIAAVAGGSSWPQAAVWQRGFTCMLPAADGTAVQTQSGVQFQTLFRNLSAADRTAIATELLPPARIKPQVEGMVDALFFWLQGQAREPYLVLDLRLLKADLAAAGGSAMVRKLVAGFPACTPAAAELLLHAALAGQLPPQLCRFPAALPAGDALVAAVLQSQLQASIGSALPDQLNLVTGVDDQVSMASTGLLGISMVHLERAKWWIDRVHWVAQHGAWLVGGGLLLIAVLAAGTLAQLSLWWGRTLLQGGTLASVPAVVAYFLAHSLPMAASLTQLGSSPKILALRLLLGAAPGLALETLPAAVALLAIGAALWVAGGLSRRLMMLAV